MAGTTKGVYTGLRDMVNGGGPGAAGSTFSGGGLARFSNSMGIAPVGSQGGGATPSATSRSRARPDVVRVGEGENRGYLDTRTGVQTAEPSYGAFSFQGLTSSDPANVARNRYGAAINMAAAQPTPIRTGGRADVVPATMSPTGAPDQIDSSGADVSRMNEERSRVPTYEAGGYVGRGGVPMRPSTTSLDLPPALARMLAMPSQSYAEGGMVGPGGVPQRPMASSPMAMNVAQQGGAPVVGVAPPGGQGRPLNFAAIDQQAQQFMQQQPQQVAQIKAQVEQAMASGEIDAQSLNMFVQVATTALQSPEMWPQLRQVLIQQGMLDAEDVGEAYDQGFLIILYIIGKTMGGGQMTTPGPQQGMPQQGAPMSAGQPPQMSMAKGGALPSKSENPDGSIPINAHEGEYVIPADVTRKLGTNHFDKMIAKARGVDMNGGGDNGYSEEGVS